LDYILKSLKKAGIPEDFQYLPMIESALKETAVSSAGAAGLWQFMPGTAKKY
jgi:membrane-bound lytic murein transglycosylase D